MYKKGQTTLVISDITDIHTSMQSKVLSGKGSSVFVACSHAKKGLDIPLVWKVFQELEF